MFVVVSANSTGMWVVEGLEKHWIDLRRGTEGLALSAPFFFVVVVANFTSNYSLFTHTPVVPRFEK